MGSRSYAWVKPAVWGAVIGVVAIMVLGFAQFGWVLGSKAEQMAREQANSAVAVALASVCADRFFAQADSAAQLAQLKLLKMDYAQREFVEKGGWAVSMDTSAPNYQLQSECAKRILEGKPA